MQFTRMCSWFLLIGFFGSNATSLARSEPFEDWLKREENYSAGGLFLNISFPGTRRGEANASPSRGDPYYFYYWVRDAGLVMDVVAMLYAGETNSERKAHYYGLLMDFSSFSR